MKCTELQIEQIDGVVYRKNLRKMSMHDNWTANSQEWLEILLPWKLSLRFFVTNGAILPNPKQKASSIRKKFVNGASPTPCPYEIRSLKLKPMILKRTTETINMSNLLVACIILFYSFATNTEFL